MRNERLACLMPVVASCALSLAGCGGSAVSPAAAPIAPAPPVTTSNIPVNLQAPSTTVIYQAAATNAAGPSSPTVTLTTDASGNLQTVVFNLPYLGGNLGLQTPSLSSP